MKPPKELPAKFRASKTSSTSMPQIPESPEVIGSNASVRRRCVSRFFAIHHKSNDIAGMLTVQLMLQRLVHKFRRGRDNFRQCSNLTQVISPAREGQYLNHERASPFQIRQSANYE